MTDFINNTQPPQNYAGVPAWFDYPSQQQPPKKPKHTKLIVLTAIILIVALSIGTIAYIFTSSKKTSCLNADDYRQLSGLNLANPIEPGSEPYTDYVLFTANTADFDIISESGAHGSQLIQKIVDFYKDHPNKSIHITLRGTYFTAESAALASQRITAAETALIRGGIPAGAVTTKDPSLLQAEDELDGDTINGETTIAIASDPTCR